MDISAIVLIVTCIFSGVSIIISIFNLRIIKNIAKSEGYLNIITASRENWTQEIKSNSSNYFSIVDTIFLCTRDSVINKYSEMSKCQYAIEITLYRYSDDLDIKDKMHQIQDIILEYISSNNFEITIEEKEKVKKLKEEIFILLSQKIEHEWYKQKDEVAGKMYTAHPHFF